MLRVENVSEIDTSPEARFLAILFDIFKRSEIRHAVMRNYESLPNGTNGSDLDILIHSADSERTKTAVYEAISESEGVPIGSLEKLGFFQVHAIGRTSNSTSPGWWGIRLDLFFGLYYNGARLFDEDPNWPVQDHCGIPVLTAAFGGMLGVLKEVLHNGIFPALYAPAARVAAGNDWQAIEHLLAPMGQPALARLKAMVLSDSPPEKMGAECSHLKHEFLRHVAAQQGVLKALRQYLAYQFAKVRRFSQPSGVVLAILGVDGAGKSTLINAILPALQAATHNSVAVRHLRPSVLPPLARLKGKKGLATGPVLEPHGAQASGSLGSLLRLTYLTLDYVLGYWLWTRPKIAKNPTVIIFDRYAYDIVLDPRRFRINLPRWVTSKFAALAPKPDLIVCLHGDPDAIAARKQELSPAETRRQIEALRAFAAHEPRAVLIATDTTIEETRDAVLNALSAYLHTKAETSR